jgi:integrase/recombinase XerD
VSNFLSVPFQDSGLQIPNSHPLPSLISQAGGHARYKFVEFFTAKIRNPNTREAYFRAVTRFLTWCELHNLSIFSLNPPIVAGYVDQLETELSKPSVKQHLAAIRMFFDFMVVGQIVPINPTSSVQGPRYVISEGKTPILDAEETRLLLNSIDTTKIGGLRDRALIAVMAYTFARISAVVGLNVDDYFAATKGMKLRFHEKGGKYNEIWVNLKLQDYIDEYIEKAGLAGKKKAPLFRSVSKKGTQLNEVRLHRKNALQMIKRRVKVAGLPANICCHTFRGTGITTFLENGGKVEVAQQIAGHASPRTTKLYDRRNQSVAREEVERVIY